MCVTSIASETVEKARETSKRARNVWEGMNRMSDFS